MSLTLILIHAHHLLSCQTLMNLMWRLKYPPSLQKTLPVMVAVVEQLRGALGESGLLVLPCVAAHIIQVSYIYPVQVSHNSFFNSIDMKTRKRRHFNLDTASISDTCQTLEHTNICWTRIRHFLYLTSLMYQILVEQSQYKSNICLTHVTNPC